MVATPPFIKLNYFCSPSPPWPRLWQIATPLGIFESQANLN